MKLKFNKKKVALMVTSFILMGISWIVDGAIEDDDMREVAREEYQKMLEEKPEENS